MCCRFIGVFVWRVFRRVCGCCLVLSGVMLGVVVLVCRCYLSESGLVEVCCLICVNCSWGVVWYMRLCGVCVGFVSAVMFV